jgi:hypothetical protein
MEHEALFAPVEDGIAKNICREQVTGELDALERERQRACQSLRERRLTYARDIFNQKVTACEQTSDCKLYRLILADDNLANLPYEGINVVCHSRMIRKNDAIRKHDMPKMHLSFSNFSSCSNLILKSVCQRKFQS